MDKEVSSKPVAWWTGEFNDEADDFMFDKTKQNHMNHINSRTHEFFPIPLYTHPHSAESVKVKQLSDEEIDKITLQFWERPFVEAHRNFARAIIKEITE
jgi:uncharacterized protein involved in tolerance to divalent cations